MEGFCPHPGTLAGWLALSRALPTLETPCLRSPAGVGKPLPPPPALGTHHAPFCLCEFDNFMSPNTSNPATFALLCLGSSTQYDDVLQVCPRGGRCKNILPFSGFVWTDHILFVRSSIGGHLGSFPCVAVVNDAAVNVCVHISPRPRSPLFWGVHPEVELLIT